MDLLSYKKVLARIREHHKKHWISSNVRSLLIGIGFLIFSLIVQKLANSYVSSLQGIPVEDLFWGHLPFLNIEALIIQGSLLAGLLTLICFICHPNLLNFGTRAVALFIAIRSFFIILTHLGQNPYQIVFEHTDFGFWAYNLLFNTSNDYFFSGHTGIPFLLALISWRKRLWRYIFLSSSCILGISMLIGRLHYSIDIFAAPFITFSIFSISRYVFPKEYKLSQE